ncbi:MAG: paraquat-inducible protein A [Phycisphaeraceae bacterium]|nr:paraquat-inducible protein A [Phycisphaerae bacterium]MBX3391720.1 paraquat-inducible protein A [Phycisphaeraceae bacterium]
MRPLTVFQFLFILAAAIMLSVHACAVVRSARASVHDFEALAAAANMHSAVDLKKRDIAEAVTFGLYSGATDQKAAIESLREAAHRSHEAQWRHLRVMLAVSGGIALVALVLARGSPRADVFVASLLVIAAVALVPGVFTPMISFINQRDLPVIGSVVAEARTKSIWGSAMDLFDAGEPWVALTIVAASISLPTVKLVLLAIVLANRAGFIDRSPGFAGTADRWSVRSESIERRLSRLASMIGQFSFVDLFVAAVFLSLFALRSLEGSTARAEPGLYFFNAYCSISLVAGLLAWRAPRPRWNPPA